MIRYMILIFLFEVIFIFQCAPKIPFYLLQEKKYEQAIQQAELIYEQHPKNKDVQRFLGDAYFQAALEKYKIGNYRASDSLFTRAEQFYANKRRILFYKHLTKGLLIAEQGGKTNLWLAINEYKNARILIPNTPDPYFWMAKAYEKIDRNNFEPIITNYRKALEYASDSQLRKTIQERLDYHIQREKTLKKFWGGKNPYKD